MSYQVYSPIHLENNYIIFVLFCQGKSNTNFRPLNKNADPTQYGEMFSHK